MFRNDIISNFNELDFSIYNYIIRNKSKVSSMKIKELAAEAHVSTSTILRFCKKLGCDGYCEFKLRYKEYLNQVQPNTTDSEDTTVKGFLSRINNKEFKNNIDDVYNVIKNSRSIIFIGIGTSGILAQYGARFFSNVGKFSLYIDDPYMPILQNLSMGTVTLALSESGNTQETINLAAQLKERGSTLVSITNNKDNTLSKISDYNITYHVPEVLIKHTNITTQIPVIYILETLARKFYN